jgi:hypothetical protein
MRRNGITKVLLGSLVLLLVFSVGPRESVGDDRPTNPDIGPTTIELLSYRASGYRFLVIGQNEVPPSGFERPDFDDSFFDLGSAPFGGGGGGLEDRNCPLRESVQTIWHVNSRLLARRTVSIPEGAANIRLLISFDNDLVGVFFNGVQLNSETIVHPNCPIPDEFRFDVPPWLVRPGENFVAFHVLDVGRESFFDARIVAELPIGSLLTGVDKVQETLENEVQSVSTSALVIEECPPPQPEGGTVVRASFKVDGTESRGQITVTDASGQRGQVLAVEHMLDGQPMYTTTAESQRAAVTVNPEAMPSARARVDLTNTTALPTVLAQPRVIAAMTECMLANDRFLNPETPCAEAVSTASEKCQSTCRGELAAPTLVCDTEDAVGFIICRILLERYQKEVSKCIRECKKAEQKLLESCP